MRRFVTLLLVTGLLAACGSSGGSGSSSSGKEGEYVDAIVETYQSGDAKDVFTEAEARCLAEGIVDTVGVDKLEAAGVEPSDIGDSDDAFEAFGKKLSESEAGDLVDVFTDGRCFDFTDLVIAQASKGSDPFGDLSKAKVRCLFDKLLDNPAFKEAMVDSILGRESSDDAFEDAFSDESKLFSIFGDCDIRPSELGG